MRRERRAALAVLAVILACEAASFSCRPTKPPGAGAGEPPPRAAIGVGSVTLRDATPDGVLPGALDFGDLETSLRGRLVASGLFPAADGGAAIPLLRLRGEIAFDGAEVEEKGVARAMVRLWLDTRPSDAPGAIEETLAGEGEQVYPITRAPAGKRALGAVRTPAPDEKRALFAKLVQRVASDLIDGFVARERLRSAPAAAVVAALHADGGDLLEPAIRIAGERRLRDQVPVLLELLDNPNETVRDAALGALIQIGDRRAVTALTKSRSLRDRREMRKILDAIAILGGDEALDYLSFVAASHDDEEIRSLAAAAKARLERRQAAGKPGAPASPAPAPAP